MNTEGFHGGFRQSMAWLHAWAGLVLSLVLYFVFITGSFGYFNTEIDHWMKPEHPGTPVELTPLAQAQLGLSYLRQTAPEATRYSVNFTRERSNGSIRAFANLKQKDADGNRFVRKTLDLRTGKPLEARDTGGGNALYRMHYSLHYMPRQLAVYIVGIATLFMLLAIVTGIVTHKKIFADFFTMRFGKGQRSWLDGHNLASVLALPFVIMITYSGLVFYTFQYSPWIAALNMGVDRAAQRELSAHRFLRLENPKATGEPADTVDVSGPLRAAQAHWPDAELRYIEIRNPGDAAARIRIGRVPADVARRGDVMEFDAVMGEQIREAPPLPMDSVVSQTLLSLHEGHFASYVLRWLYFVSGLLGAGMIATGSMLWAKKRITLLKGAPPPMSLTFVQRANLGTIVGLPLGCVAYFWANRLLPLDLADRAEWEIHCLFVVWGLSFAHAGARELRRAWREQVGLLAALCVSLPLLNAVTTDTHLGVSVVQGDWTRAGFDLAALTFGLLLFAIWPRLTQPAPSSAPALSDNPIASKATA